MKKLSIYLSIVVVLFALLFYVSQQSNKASSNADNVYGIPENKLHEETLKQLDDPNYQNIILPDQLASAMKEQGDLFVYFFASNCPHCQRTTPIIQPVVAESGIDLKMMNVLEFPETLQKYNIQSWPTFVHYKDGQEVSRLVGEVSPTGEKDYVSLDQVKQLFAEKS